MNLPCQPFLKEFLPVIRQTAVIDLVTNHDYTQMKASKALGITQASVSKYLSMETSHAISKELESTLVQIGKHCSQSLVNNQVPKFDFSQICSQCNCRDEHALLCNLYAPSAKK